MCLTIIVLEQCQYHDIKEAKIIIDICGSLSGVYKEASPFPVEYKSCMRQIPVSENNGLLLLKVKTEKRRFVDKLKMTNK